MQRTERKEIDNGFVKQILIYIVNPFVAFLNSLFNIDKRSSRIILYLWFILFGFMFRPMQEITGDSFAYYERFVSFNTNEFGDIIQDYFSGQSNYKDLYEYFTYWLVKSFTDNYHFLFALWAAVFGFFYLKAVGSIIEYFDRRNYWASFFLILLFMLSNPIYNINGFRFWTAAWMGVYAAIKILRDKKYIYFLLVAATVLVHGGFSIFVLLILLATLLRKQTNILTIVYIISFFLSIVSVSSLIEPYLGRLPLFFSNFLENYAEEGVVSDKFADREALPFYAKLFRSTPTYFINILAIALLYLNMKKRIDLSHNTVFVFALIILTMCNLLDTSVLSVSGRYLRVAEPLVVLTWFMNHKQLRDYQWLILAFPFFYWYRLLYLVRDIIGISDLMLYIAPAPLSIVKSALFLWQ